MQSTVLLLFSILLCITTLRSSTTISPPTTESGLQRSTTNSPPATENGLQQSKNNDSGSKQQPDHMIPVEHEGCPYYTGYGDNDPYSPSYLAGAIPCAPLHSLSPEHVAKVQSVPPLAGLWVSEADSYGTTHSWEIKATFTEFVRNKAFEDWNNQCVQVVEYTHLTAGERSGYEVGMFLLDWKFGMHYVDHPKLINTHGQVVEEESGPVPNLSRHFVYTNSTSTKVVLVNPKESGLHSNVDLQDSESTRNITTAAGRNLLKYLQGLHGSGNFDFIWEVETGNEIVRQNDGPAPPDGTELPITPRDDMSFAIAFKGDSMYTYSINVPGNDNGLVTLKRDPFLKHLPATPQPKPKSNCPFAEEGKVDIERQMWEDLIDNMQGNWESELGHTLSLTMPPHYIRSRDAFHVHFAPPPDAFAYSFWQKLEEFAGGLLGAKLPGDLDIFTLCTHSRVRDFFKVWKNPLSTPELTILNYRQSINVFVPEKEGPGAGVHEEVGFFVFDWPNKKISRHGVIPHGSTFEMVAGFPAWSNLPLPELSSPTIPRFGPNDQFVFKGFNVEAYLNGMLEGDGKQGFQDRPDVPINDPAELLNDLNKKNSKDLKRVTTISLRSGSSINLPFVDHLASRGDPNQKHFVSNMSSNFYLAEHRTSGPLLQYIQVVNFNFRVKGTPDIDPSKGTQSLKSVKWPHVIVSSLRKVK